MHEVSNAFDDHFSTIGTKLANEVPLVTDSSSYADYIVTYSSDNKFIFSRKVFSLLNKFSISKATGLDNISVGNVQILFRSLYVTFSTTL